MRILVAIAAAVWLSAARRSLSLSISTDMILRSGALRTRGNS